MAQQTKKGLSPEQRARVKRALKKSTGEERPGEAQDQTSRNKELLARALEAEETNAREAKQKSDRARAKELLARALARKAPETSTPPPKVQEQPPPQTLTPPHRLDRPPAPPAIAREELLTEEPPPTHDPEPPGSPEPPALEESPPTAEAAPPAGEEPATAPTIARDQNSTVEDRGERDDPSKTDEPAEREGSPSDAPDSAEEEGREDGEEKKKGDVNELIDFVHEAVELPIDAWAVAAFLESKGLRDIDAINDFGKRHIFELAEEVNAGVLEREINPTQNDEEFELKGWSKLRAFIFFYLKGTVFALPMTGQIIAILLLRYSLWAWLDFSVMAASLVAIGTISSFVITGGIVQALGRENTFYARQGNFILLERVCRQLLALGMTGAAIVSVVSVLSNTFVPYFELGGLLTALLYFCLLTPLWLFLAVLYSLKDNVPILAVTLIGTAGVHFMMSFFEYLGIHIAHAVGLVIANLCAAGWAHWRITKLKKDVDAKYQKSRVPRPAILFHIVKPFLAYGTLYFTFLFVDRLVGWSASTWRQPLFIWFRTSYELGMDWALISLVFTIAVLEYTINEFSRTIIPIQKHYAASNYKGHNGHFQRFYKRQLILLIVIAFLSVIFTYFAVSYLKNFDHIREVRDFFASPITYWTYWFASAGYSLLAIGLLNGLFFFSMAKPWVVVRCMQWALIVDVVVGYILSRAISYEYSVVGLVAGALVFAILTSKEARKAFKHLDYFYYSAF